jgi:hypothetical protein
MGEVPPRPVSAAVRCVPPRNSQGQRRQRRVAECGGWSRRTREQSRFWHLGVQGESSPAISSSNSSPACRHCRCGQRWCSSRSVLLESCTQAQGGATGHWGAGGTSSTHVSSPGTGGGTGGTPFAPFCSFLVCMAQLPGIIPQALSGPGWARQNTFGVDVYTIRVRFRDPATQRPIWALIRSIPTHFCSRVKLGAFDPNFVVLGAQDHPGRAVRRQLL